jgi:hypothetical protein
MSRAKFWNSLNFDSIPGGIFLVRQDAARKGSVLTLHSFESFSDTKKRDLQETLSDGGCNHLRFATHRPKALATAQSLAALELRFGGGEIAYDPTAIFTRASETVRCTEMIRAALGRKAGKFFLHSERRTLYVVLNDKSFEGRGLTYRAQTAEAMAAVAKAVAAWKEIARLDFDLAVRVGFEPPRGVALVAVDERSRERRGVAAVARLATRVRKAASAVAVGALAAGATSAAYADGPDPTAAVSTPNLTIIGEGQYDDVAHDDLMRGNFGLEGAIPLGHAFGFQADGGVGSDNYWGGAGHLFWRDPSWGLIGAYGSDESLQSITMQRYAGQAEFYLDQVTLGGAVGEQQGDVLHGVFGKADIGFYVTPNFVLRAGFEGTPGGDFGRAGFEFQPAAHSLSGLSLFADTAFGRGTEISFGIKFHFGEAGETLIYRDRHEDPETAVFNDMAIAAGAHRQHYTRPPA